MEKIKFLTEDRFNSLAPQELAFLGHINTNKYVSEAEKLSALKSCDPLSGQCNTQPQKFFCYWKPANKVVVSLFTLTGHLTSWDKWVHILLCNQSGMAYDHALWRHCKWFRATIRDKCLFVSVFREAAWHITLRCKIIVLFSTLALQLVPTSRIREEKTALSRGAMG